ncbi:MAG: glycosyltransferase family 4 protein [Candidatus Paceibacterota bacterium]
MKKLPKIKNKLVRLTAQNNGIPALNVKICLYLEYYYFLGGILYKNIGTGLLASYENQRRTLKSLNIPFTEKWDGSCDILQINTPWLKSLWLIKKARRQGKKVIIWAHVVAEEIPEVFRFGKLIFPIAKKYLAYAYGQADLIFCPSEYTKNLLIENYGLPAEKLFVQSNGVDCSIYYANHQKKEEGKKQFGCEKLVIGSVGLVIPRKGVDKFIKLAETHPEQQFIWFGKIYSKLMAKGLPKVLPNNVKFTGYVSSGDICAAFNAIDIFIFLSSGENQGMVLLEAAATGLPILVKELPTYRGWLIHNENCLIAKNDDEVKKYLDILIEDKSLRERLSKNAQKLAEKEDIKFLSKKLLKTYKKLLEK